MDANKMLSEIQTGLEGFIARTGAEFKAEKARVTARLEQLEAELHRPDGGSSLRAGFKSSIDGYTTPGQRFIDAADLDLFRKTGRLRTDLKHFWPACERKTLIDSSTVGLSTPGILGSTQIEPNIVNLARRRLVVRALLRSKPIESAQLDWIKELAFTNAASPQTEGNAKAESANTFQVAAERVRTLAHWIPATRQVLDDLPALRDFLDSNLMY